MTTPILTLEDVLGVIWYQMLTGDLSQGLSADWRDELTERGVPGPMIDLLGRCVAGRSERRLADAGEVARQLESLLQARGDRKRPLPETAVVDRADQVERTTHPIPQTPTEKDDIAKRMEQARPGVQQAHAVAKPKPDSLTHRQKVDRLIEELGKRGIGASTVAPPFFRTLWAMGLNVPPPFFLGFGTLALLIGGVFPIMFGTCMTLILLLFPPPRKVPVEEVVLCLVGAGLFFGLFGAAYYRVKAAWLRLPSWENYPET